MTVWKEKRRFIDRGVDRHIAHTGFTGFTGFQDSWCLVERGGERLGTNKVAFRSILSLIPLLDIVPNYLRPLHVRFSHCAAPLSAYSRRSSLARLLLLFLHPSLGHLRASPFSLLCPCCCRCSCSTSSSVFLILSLKNST